MNLRLEVGAAIQRHSLWAPGQRVAVAVSGGADSVALLHLLLETAKWHRGVLSVVTVDHGVRPGSGEDAAFVAEMATRLGVPCQTFRVSPARSSEAALREARHAAFASLDVDRVATAHHARDQVETVLLRLVRGTATTGLAGMRWSNGRLVRPLLGTWPESLRSWLGERGVGWREDPTNADPRADRNRIRHEVLPVLRTIRPGAERALARTAARLAEESDLLAAFVADHDPGEVWPAEWLATAPQPLLRLLIRNRGPGLASAAVDRALHALARSEPFRVGGWSARPSHGGFAWVRCEP